MGEEEEEEKVCRLPTYLSRDRIPQKSLFKPGDTGDWIYS